MKRIVIIGAGPTGLVTAHSLSEKTNYDVQVFDANPFLGGLVGSGNIDGMVYDFGPHIFHSGHEDITNFWRDNFGDLLLEKEFFYKNYKDGIMYDYPISWESVEKFPDKIKEKVRNEISGIKSENLMRARNFKECVIELVGPTLQSIFFEKYTEKLWGIPPEKMSANWAPKRIELRKKHKAFWAGQFSACGKYGAGKVMERLGQMVENKGGCIHLNHKVSEFKTSNYNINEIVFENGKNLDVSDSIIVSTIPLKVLCEVLEIPCSLMFNSVRLVYMVFSKDFVLPKGVHSIYYSQEEFDFHRISEQKQYTDYGYPKDKTLLVFEVSFTNRKHLGLLKDDEIIERILDQFSSLGMVDKKQFVKGFTHKLPFVNPIMKIGFEKELAQIDSEISKFNNLHTAGGAAEFIYGDVQTMVARGWDMAELLFTNHYEINKNIKKGKRFKFNKDVNLCGYNVGERYPPIIVAEIGINNKVDIVVAKELLRQVKNSGCDVAKLQMYSSGNGLSATGKEAMHLDSTFGMKEATNEVPENNRLTLGEQTELIEYAENIDIPIITTPSDESNVDFLFDAGVQAFEIASFDLVNLPFLKYVSSKGLPIILSTGMSEFSEIEDAIDAIALLKNPNLILLHCVSTYPSDLSDVNLKVMQAMREAFHVPVGYSDHTTGKLAGIASFALGTDVLEKRFTIEEHLDGPEHLLSTTPQEMSELVNCRDEIFVVIGDGINRPAAVGHQHISRQQKSIFAKQPIPQGTELSLENISIRESGHGLLPRYLPVILGKKVTRGIEFDMPITWDDLLTIAPSPKISGK